MSPASPLSYDEILRAIQRAVDAQEVAEMWSRQGDGSGPSPSDQQEREAFAPLDALGPEALPHLERLAREGRQAVAALAASQARRIRHAQDTVRTAANLAAPNGERGAALAASFAAATTDQARREALALIAKEKDPRAMIGALSALVSTDGGAGWARVITRASYVPAVVWSGVAVMTKVPADAEPLVRQLLAMPPPVGPDAAAALATTAGLVAAHPLGPLLRALPKQARRDMLHRISDARDAVKGAAYASFLEDPDCDVRRSAASGLGAHGRPEDCNPLVRRLDDPDPLVRSLAAESLAALADRKAAAVRRDDIIAALRAHAEDADRTVREGMVSRLAWLRRAPWVNGQPSESRRRAGMAAFEGALGAVGSDPGHASGARHSVALEDLVAAVGDMLTGGGGEPEYRVLLESLRHPHALLFARHVGRRLNHVVGGPMTLGILKDPGTDREWKRVLLDGCVSIPAFLFEVLEHDGDAEFRAQAIGLLEELGTPETFTKIRQAIARDPDPRLDEAVLSAEAAYHARKALYRGE